MRLFAVVVHIALLGLFPDARKFGLVESADPRGCTATSHNGVVVKLQQTMNGTLDFVISESC